MGRKIGSKNKNTNTAKNKNIININVNTSTKKKRGRPSKTDSTSNSERRNQLTGGWANNSRPPVMVQPPTQIISPPQPDPNSSLLSSFITSKLLNESSFPSRTNISYDEPIGTFNSVGIEPSRRDTLNLRESMIPKVADTPIKLDVKPSPPPPPPPQTRPPPPPPPPIKANDVKPQTNIEFNSGGLMGQDAINAELKYRASEAGKAEMARKKAEKEAKKAEKETNKEGKSMLDSMGMTLPSPFTPAKPTPAKPQEQSTALIVRP